MLYQLPHAMSSSKKTAEHAVRADYPDVERVQLRQVVQELDALACHAKQALALDQSDPRATVIQSVVHRVREALWRAAVVVDEVTPDAIADEIDVSPDTIRYWVRRGYVRSRRRGGRILVDRDSALRYAGER